MACILSGIALTALSFLLYIQMYWNERLEQTVGREKAQDIERVLLITLFTSEKGKFIYIWKSQNKNQEQTRRQQWLLETWLLSWL